MAVPQVVGAGLPANGLPVVRTGLSGLVRLRASSHDVGPL